MNNTEFSRKLDKMGRIMIPIKLREQMGLVVGENYFFSTREENGKKYICIDCGEVHPSDSLEYAMEILQANGMTAIKTTE